MLRFQKHCMWVREREACVPCLLVVVCALLPLAAVAAGVFVCVDGATHCILFPKVQQALARGCLVHISTVGSCLRG